MKMRAKLRVASTQIHEAGGPDNGPWEDLAFCAVAKNDVPYPPDGSDENNTFAKWTPSADLRMTITNPALVGKFTVGQEFYADFTPVPVSGSGATE